MLECPFNIVKYTINLPMDYNQASFLRSIKHKARMVVEKTRLIPRAGLSPCSLLATGSSIVLLICKINNKVLILAKTVNELVPHVVTQIESPRDSLGLPPGCCIDRWDQLILRRMTTRSPIDAGRSGSCSHRAKVPDFSSAWMSHQCVQRKSFSGAYAYSWYDDDCVMLTKQKGWLN